MLTVSDWIEALAVMYGIAHERLRFQFISSPLYIRCVYDDSENYGWSHARGLQVTENVVLELADGELNANSLVLSIHSSFFQALLSSDSYWSSSQPNLKTPKRISLQNIQMAAMKIALDYMYEGYDESVFDSISASSPQGLIEAYSDVLSVADQLLLDGLSMLCQRRLQRLRMSSRMMYDSSFVVVNLSNAFEMYHLSATYHAPLLQSVCISYLTANLDSLFGSG
jgi:hypothetical protein